MHRDRNIIQEILALVALKNSLYNKLHLSTVYGKSVWILDGKTKLSQSQYGADFTNNFLRLGDDAYADRRGLTAILSKAGISAPDPAYPCTYKFDFNASDPTTYIAEVRKFEELSVATYLGVLPTIANKDVMLILAGIGNANARHGAYLRSLDGQVAIPRSYDVSISPSQSYSAFSKNIVSCPANSKSPAISAKVFPTLTPI